MELNIITASAIRESFIDFFLGKGHKFVRSSPVVTLDDPTLLFTNAGMNQFKPIFLGENKEGYKRVVNTQKCIRVSGKHNDLEAVGNDTYHHTFFEMLGNWSFGDYYKEEAIAWAWELLTKVWELPKDRLFVTVHDSDDEAAEIWKKSTGLDPERILKFGDKDNFWEMGEVGPCGPCSEIHYDTGDRATRKKTYADPERGINSGNDRYLEIWNLVFIQYQRLGSGELKPLKDRHVDTGLGFERICAILQDTNSNYETDVFSSLIENISMLSGVPYTDGKQGMPHRVIADHVRTLTFAITDGAIPGNEGRGYVLRRILRRASRYCRSLNQNEPFICKLVPMVVREMKGAFPELKEREEFVSQVIQSEEERFIKTLDQGLERFRKVADNLKSSGKSEIFGEDAFTLYDTYGFPLDLTCLIAEENGLTVDKQGYEKCMQGQHDRAREAAKFDNVLANEEGWTLLSKDARSEFTGYASLSGTGKLLRYRIDNGLAYVVLDRTPFYAESGGQVGDTGTLYNGMVELEVLDTIKLMEMSVHKCRLVKGNLTPDTVPVFNSEVDPRKRAAIMRSHSATHLLQAALRSILGEHVQQTGSRVGPDDLRFDFTHHRAMTQQEVFEVEELVNWNIRESLKVWDVICPIQEAKKWGAMALFGEKYGDEVRVIKMGESSMELCGGTHVASTGQIGFFKITGEASIASGVRRIEAITGEEILRYLREKDQILNEIGSSLKAKPGQEARKVREMVGRVKQQEKQLLQLRSQQAGSMIESYLQDAKQVGDYKYVLIKAGGLEKKELNSLIDSLAPRLKKTVAVITNPTPGNLSIIVLVAKDLAGRLKAGDLANTLGAVAEGRGGGRNDRAQAGSKKPEKEGAVMEEAEKVLEKTLGKL
jgi:alanyl-tRNA synthetase